jgi:hypothetical protein
MKPFGCRQRTRTGLGHLFLTLLLSAIALFSTTGWSRAETTLSASLKPDRFAVDTGGILTITINGSRSADIHLPTVSGFRLQGRGRSSQVQMINGSFSSALSYTYVIQAENPGKYTIPPITVSVDGSTLTTKPITFEVTPSGSATPNQGNIGTSPTRLRSDDADKIAFLGISELQDKSWTGEVIPLQIKAYFRQGIKANLNALPVLKGDGFVMPQLDQKPLQTEESVNGTIYSVLTWESYISAVKEGKHTLTLEIEATLLFPQRRNMFPGFGDQDILQDDFFQNFFGGFTSKNVKVASRPITIEARPLPTDNQPHDFSGAIGHFNLSVHAKPMEAEVGDPVTLTMIVSGSGNFDRVEVPIFAENPTWKIYPPSVEFKQGDRPIEGSKKYEQAVVIKDDHVTEIPPVSFVYFDPATEKYMTLKSAAIPLSVKHENQATAPSPASPAPTTPKAEPENRGIAGLAPIHLQMGELQKKIIPLFAKTWFIAMLMLNTLLLLGIFAWKARLRYLRNNPEIQKEKKLSELLTKNMPMINEAAATNDSRRYLAACRKTIQEHLGHHWETESSAITLADLKARLQPSSTLIAIFEAAEQSAYADFTLSAAQIRQYTDNLQKELSELR